jgi:hypothetical protein
MEIRRKIRDRTHRKGNEQSADRVNLPDCY